MQKYEKGRDGLPKLKVKKSERVRNIKESLRNSEKVYFILRKASEY